MHPTPKHVNQSDFAKLHGWDRSRVTRLKEAGLLVLTARGLVDVEASNRLIGENRDPSRQGVADYFAEKRAEKAHSAADGQNPSLTPSQNGQNAPNGEKTATGINGLDMFETRTKVKLQTDLEKLKREKRENDLAEGKLVPVEDVRQAWAEVVRLLRMEAESLVKELKIELDLSEDLKRRADDRFDGWLAATSAKMAQKWRD